MLKVVKNNPKKTIFGISLLSYGVYYANNWFNDYRKRRVICAQAEVYGDKIVMPDEESRKVTVILNPVSNNGNGMKQFYKDIFPLLNLNGYKVNVIKLEKKEEAKHLMSVIKPADQDYVMVAGGDGTLLEVVTGLMRREDLRNDIAKIPLLVAPLGSKNQFFNEHRLVDGDDLIEKNDKTVKLLREGQLKPTRCIQISSLASEKNNNFAFDDKPDATATTQTDSPKDIYAMSGVEWSMDRDIQKNGKRKWLFGPGRYYFQYGLTGLLGKYKTENKSMTLLYSTEYCDGKCDNFKQRSALPILADKKPLNTDIIQTKKARASSWWRSTPFSFLLGRSNKKIVEKDKNTQNKELEDSKKPICKRCDHDEIIKDGEDVDMQEIQLDDVRGVKISLEDDKLKVSIRQRVDSFVDHIEKGISNKDENECGIASISDDESVEEIYCSRLKLLPTVQKETDKFYIDNDEVDVVPIEAKVINNGVYIYTSKSKRRLPVKREKEVQ